VAPRKDNDPLGRRWYRHRKWKRIRRQQIDRNPWCEECEKRGLVVLATIVDHVHEHGGDWDAFISGKLRSLCRECHERRHGRDRRPLYWGTDGWPVWATPDGQAPLPGKPKPQPEDETEAARRRRALVRSLIA
jgi:hypothetical protein